MISKRLPWAAFLQIKALNGNGSFVLENECVCGFQDVCAILFPLHVEAKRVCGEEEVLKPPVMFA